MICVIYQHDFVIKYTFPTSLKWLHGILLTYILYLTNPIEHFYCFQQFTTVNKPMYNIKSLILIL